VLGFGLAREAEAEEVAITADGALVKVTPYSAPEMGDAVPDCRGDLYSLGCVWFHLLTGRPPFSGRDPLELLHAHRTEPIWPILDLVPNLPPGLADMLEALLAKKPAQRLGSAHEVIALLDAALNPDILGAPGVKPDKTMLFSTLEMLAVRKKFTVLVCDDQEVTLRCLGETLRRLGMTVLCTRDGKAAVEILRKRPCDLVLTDLKVPSLWGRPLLESLRAAAPPARLVLTRTGPAAEALYRDQALKIFACLERPLDLFAVRRTAQAVLKEGGRV
ncbi:MAG: response regulator, partial [Planctomycetota bacterium]|nr:response regulator [Planctomycetota bacterium]